jgi:hypothetical protein
MVGEARRSIELPWRTCKSKSEAVRDTPVAADTWVGNGAATGCCMIGDISLAGNLNLKISFGNLAAVA